VEPTQIGPKERMNLSDRSDRDREWLFLLCPSEWVPPEDGDIIQSPKVWFEIKDRMMDNVQNCDSYIYLPLSQTYKKYICLQLAYHICQETVYV
jgi:hypothetical protein